MKLITKVTQLIADAVMHYSCMRLRFRSRVLQDSLLNEEAAICIERCCPAKS